MEADSTEIRKGKNKGNIQNYYACKNKDCSGRIEVSKKYKGRKRNYIVAQVLDESIKDHIRNTVLSNPSYIQQIVDFTNRELMESLPDKKKIKRTTERRIKELTTLKNGIYKALEATDPEADSSAFHRYMNDIKENANEKSKLDKLLEEQSRNIEELSRYLISEDFLKRSLEILVTCETVFEPDKQRALIKAVIGEISVGLEEIEIHLNAGSLHKLARHASDPNKVKKRGGGYIGSAWFGPILDGFVCTTSWHARRDSNPKPSGP
ncbi:MAG: hypothetical protein K8S62_06400 [Candidatus Sabulitectum sp.]|nr:hypothetical protein [Candidatus Sabulitectum sp.]